MTASPAPCSPTLSGSAPLRALIIIVLLALTLPAALFAQKKSVTATVILSFADAFTGEPVKDLTLYVLNPADSTLIKEVKGATGNRNNNQTTFAWFDIEVRDSFLLKAVAPGYKPLYYHWVLTKRQLHGSGLRKSFEMTKERKNKDHTLQGVTVKATRVKFYYKGDTIVYDADAFELAEGSMLDELIRQLPGTELKEGGEIFVNGRRVDELLLNGKDFFSSDRKLMLENLPSYMVKNIKVYESLSKIQKAMGDTLNKQLSMDIRLKKEYSVSTIANVEGGIGTDGRYLARLFGLRFTKNSRLTLSGNINNLSDSRKPGNSGDWSPLQQATGVTQVIDGGLNYKYDNGNLSFDNELSATRRRVTNSPYTNQENFLQSGNTYRRSFYRSLYHSNQLTYNGRLLKTEGELISFFQAQPSFDYIHYNSLVYDHAATLNEDRFSDLGKAWRDSIAAPNAGSLLRRYALNRIINTRKDNDHRLTTGLRTMACFSPFYSGRLSLWLLDEISYVNSRRRLYDHYLLEYFQTPAAPDFRNRFDNNYSSSLKNDLDISTGNLYVFNDDNKRLDFLPRYTFTYQHQKQNRSLYLLNRLSGWDSLNAHVLGELPSTEQMLLALDNGNSVFQTQTDHIHRLYLQIQSNAKVGKVWAQFNAHPSLSFERNSMDYRRGTVLDTTVRRNKARFDTDVQFYMFPDGNWPWPWRVQLTYNYSTALPAMTYLVNYRDDSNPLYIVNGNPHLRNSYTHTFSAEFRRNMKCDRMLNTKASANIRRQMVAMGYIYDTRTGVRTVTPQNLNGNWDISGQLGYSARLDKDSRFTYKANTSLTYTNSVDLIGEDNAPAPAKSTVHTTNIDEALSLNARFTKAINIGAKADIHYQRSTSGRENFSAINVWDFDYGLTAVWELPLSFQFSSDLTMYSRRGYDDHSMNTNDLVWNARLSKRFLKGKLVMMLDAFDLLHELSNVRRTINAQGRTETWNNVTPHYAMLHVIYKFNKQPKKH